MRTNFGDETTFLLLHFCKREVIGHICREYEVDACVVLLMQMCIRDRYYAGSKWRAFKSPTVSLAVSYTHLDVYKRQTVGLSTV